MARFTLDEVVQATGGRLVYDVPDRTFSQAETDTRAISQGALFVALKGERFNGHDYVLKAREQGALGAVVSEDGRNTTYPVLPSFS